jgi:hypothetical protein
MNTGMKNFEIQWTALFFAQFLCYTYVRIEQSKDYPAIKIVQLGTLARITLHAEALNGAVE